MKRATFCAALFLVIGVPAAGIAQDTKADTKAASRVRQEAQKPPQHIAGELQGIIHFVPFSMPPATFYSVHTVGIASGVLESIGRCQVFTVQTPAPPTAPGGPQGVVDGHFWMIGANGDRLDGEYEGETQPGVVPGKMLGVINITITGGTGRFAKASGILHAVVDITPLPLDMNDPSTWTWAVAWEIEGTIVF